MRPHDHLTFAPRYTLTERAVVVGIGILGLGVLALLGVAAVVGS